MSNFRGSFGVKNDPTRNQTLKDQPPHPEKKKKDNGLHLCVFPMYACKAHADALSRCLSIHLWLRRVFSHSEHTTAPAW